MNPYRKCKLIYGDRKQNSGHRAGARGWGGWGWGGEQGREGGRQGNLREICSQSCHGDAFLCMCVCVKTY